MKKVSNWMLVAPLLLLVGCGNNVKKVDGKLEGLEVPPGYDVRAEKLSNPLTKKVDKTK